MKRKLIRAVIRVLGTVGVVVLVAWIVIAQPSCCSHRPSNITVDPATLREHVETLALRLSPRDWQETNHLNQCADYIAQQFKAAGATVELQPFTASKRQYQNVIARFHADSGPRIIVGAHYDTCATDAPYDPSGAVVRGADDNASGIASLIELANLLGRNSPSSEVDLVAYVLEEPPFFRTQFMGSAIHAKSLADAKANVRGVIVLEMVGYFSDARGSQMYPNLLLRLMYPSRGNFIAVASRWDQGDWIKTVKLGMKGRSDLSVYSIRAPAMIPGIDFSDHLNYWPHGFKAVMVTDTAFYRNQAYHTTKDTPDRLDYNRMAKVVAAVFETIRSM